MTDKTERKQNDETEAKPKRLRDLSIPELMTGAVTSVFVAMLGSRLGTAGTLVGAAIASVGYAVINHVLTAGVDHTKRRWGKVGASVAATSVALFGASLLLLTGAEVGAGRSLDGRPGATSVGVEKVAVASAVAQDRTSTDEATATPSASTEPTATPSVDTSATPAPTSDSTATAEPTASATSSAGPTASASEAAPTTQPTSASESTAQPTTAATADAATTQSSALTKK